MRHLVTLVMAVALAAAAQACVVRAGAWRSYWFAKIGTGSLPGAGWA
jgi:hypothetical protein